MSGFLVFQKFNDKGLAVELGALLEENGIEHKLDDTTQFGLGFSDTSLIKEYRIKLRKEDFAKADDLLHRVYAKEIDSVAEDHYLFSFTDEELMDIIGNRHEWNPLDFLLAQKILRERGKEVKPEVINAMDKQRMETLARPEPSPQNLVFVGYALALIGGIGGFFVAWHLSSYKKTLPNGETVHGYPEKDRKHATWILLISLVWLGIGLVRWAMEV